MVTSIGARLDHQAIFVETDNNTGSGHLFQVTGTVAMGMSFGHRKDTKPEDWPSFITKSHIGTIAQTDFDRVQAIVDKIPPPAKQFNGPRRIDPKKPLYTCQDWTKEAIQALKEEGLLKEEGVEGSLT